MRTSIPYLAIRPIELVLCSSISRGILERETNQLRTGKIYPNFEHWLADWWQSYFVYIKNTGQTLQRLLDSETPIVEF